MYELHAAPQDHYKSGVRKTQAQVPFWPCNALQNALSAPKPSRATKNLTFAFFLPLPNIVDMIASFGLPKRWDCGQYRPGLGLLVLLIWLEKNETASRWPARPRFRKSVTASFEAGAGSSKNMTHHVSLESSTNAKEATATPSRQKIRRFFRETNGEAVGTAVLRGRTGVEEGGEGRKSERVGRRHENRLQRGRRSAGSKGYEPKRRRRRQKFKFGGAGGRSSRRWR